MYWDKEEKYDLNIFFGLNDEEIVFKERNFLEEMRICESIWWVVMLIFSVWMYSCEGLGYIWKEVVEIDGVFFFMIFRGVEN